MRLDKNEEMKKEKRQTKKDQNIHRLFCFQFCPAVALQQRDTCSFLGLPSFLAASMIHVESRENKGVLQVQNRNVFDSSV